MAPALWQRRRDRAFERLYRAHVGDVYRYALALTGNQADAEDVAQTVFMNAYRALDRGEVPEKPKNWLITITHNVCRQRFRHDARRPSEVALNEDVAEAIVPSDDGPTASDIQRALGYLAFNQRAALIMRELEGRSYAEIAEILGLSVSAVETTIFRARRALREQLEGSLSCAQAEAAISKQLDGKLPHSERGALRAHLRECGECSGLARRQRAQRHAWKALGAVPIPVSLPASLASLFGGGGGAAVGAAVATKAAAVTIGAAIVAGGGYEAAKHVSSLPLVSARAASSTTTPRPAAPTATHPQVIHRDVTATAHPKGHHAVAVAADTTRGRSAGHRADAGHRGAARHSAAEAHTTAVGQRRAAGHGAAAATHPTKKPHPAQSHSTQSKSKPVHATHPAQRRHVTQRLQPKRPTHPTTPVRKHKPTAKATPKRKTHPAQSHRTTTTEPVATIATDTTCAHVSASGRCTPAGHRGEQDSPTP